MKKRLFIILFVLLHGLLFAEELQFRVTERAKYVPLRQRTQIKYLEAESIVTCRNKINYSQALTETEDLAFTLAILLLKDRDEYWTEAEKLTPLDTHDTFLPSIAINHSRENKELWVPSYYADVLNSRKRDTLISFESYWLPWEAIDDFTGEVLENWHTRYNINENGEVMFYNAAIRLTLTDYCFMVKDIQKTDYGYQVICVRTGYLDLGLDAGSHFNWSYIKDDEYFSLLMVEDGDYLDLYVDNFSQQFGSLIKVRQEFAEQFESLIKTNTCDLTSVQWPQRADGSTDYSIPTLNTSEEVKQLEPIDFSIDSSDIENQLATQNSARTSAMPFWAWLAIIGGAVAVAGGAAVFAVRRRKG